MAQIKIVRADEVQPQNIRGFGNEAGQIRKILTTEKLFFNIDEVNPGFSPHQWHTHTKYKAEGYDVEYPADFEEVYFILSGRGLIQWKTESGAIEEREVGPGDTMHMPAGVIEHQLINNGTEKIRLAVIGCPPPRRIPT